jgi:exopolysaccharide production protein ExoZ
MGETAAGKLTGIEASRGIAAVVVVLYHVARHLDKSYGLPLLKGTLQFGHAGVDLFFVLSGFIILHVHYRDIGNPARLGHYLGRRFTRVMPIYWVVLTLTLVMGFGRRLPSFAQLAWSVSLLPSNSVLILDIAWTLRHEIVFYAIFCVLILNRRAGIAIFALWLPCIVLGSLYGFRASWLPESLDSAYNLEFFFGMAVAYRLRFRSVAAPRLILISGVVLFAAAALTEDMRLWDGYADIGRLVYGLPAALIVLGTAALGRETSVNIPGFLRMLGAASYSIYLFQFIFIGILWQLWLITGLDRVTPHAASFPLLAVGGVMGGILASRLIEYPLIRLVRGDRRRVQARAAVG